MLSEIFQDVVNFFNGLIGAGSTAAQGGYNTVIGSLGNVFGA